jgi:2-succinyl-5-enolpyruvyl-6-hydroxy-3-cyclohexene-1-carboxylate synthase
MFANHSLYNANLNEVVSVENDTKINEAISIWSKRACTYKCSFEEPLYETVSELSVPTVIASKCRTHQKMRYVSMLRFGITQQKNFLVGVNEPRAISDSTIETLAADESVVVLTETTSNVHHPTFINTIDSLITPLRTKSLRIFVLKY